jgi:hypothetical protein
MDAVDTNIEVAPVTGLLAIEELMALVADRLRVRSTPNAQFLELTAMYFKLQAQLKVPRIESGKKRGRPYGAKSRSKEEKLKANVQDLVKEIEYKRKLDGQVETALEG